MKPIDGDTTQVTVDDNKTVLMSFSLAAKMLRFKHFAMYQLSQEFLDDIPEDSSNIELVFLDWNLVGSPPEMQYGALIRTVKDRMPHVLTYVLSTSLDEIEMNEAEKAGANGWICKAALVKTLTRFNKEYQSKIGEFYVWR